jgi:nitrite reductase/ring-hydroxylating ferredoxin subunit
LQGYFAEILLKCFVKTQHFSKETGRFLKNSAISNAISSAGQASGRLDYFPVKVHDQGFQKI